jgi:hypothetical protein
MARRGAGAQRRGIPPAAGTYWLGAGAEPVVFVAETGGAGFPAFRMTDAGTAAERRMAGIGT